MTGEDRSHEVRQEAATRRMQRSRGRRAKTIEAPEDNESFQDYAAHRLWSFLCAQLATALVGYVVLVLGDAWLDKQRMASAALASAVPALPMAAALVVACL